MDTSYIREIIIALKEDKGCAQPYRNYAAKELETAILWIDKGHHMTNMKPPGELESGSTRTSWHETDEPIVCICPAGGVHAKCPVHGTMK